MEEHNQGPPLNTEHLDRCLMTLQRSLEHLQECSASTIEYEVFRNATVKGFELSLEIAGKLLRKALKPYFASPKAVHALNFKDLFRYGARHGILEVQEAERWLAYRDNRNDTAHDYGAGFAEETLLLLPRFIDDARGLIRKISRA